MNDDIVMFFVPIIMLLVFYVASTPKLWITIQPLPSMYTTWTFDTRVQHSKGAKGKLVTLALYDKITGLVVDREFATAWTDTSGAAWFRDIRIGKGGKYYLMASAPGLPEVQSDIFTMVQPVMCIDAAPPSVLYTDETFLAKFSCRDPQTKKIVTCKNGSFSSDLYLAHNDKLVGRSSREKRGTAIAKIHCLIKDLPVAIYYLQVSIKWGGSIRTANFEIREPPAPLDTLGAYVEPDMVLSGVDSHSPYDVATYTGIKVPVIGGPDRDLNRLLS